ncbi:hypothetical protein A3Q56_06198 [Intoshia linei]|uniref:EF-hand domain-containing protein n=1 Tax=Intoshia linei TaxID=1819745 RepID=A0A177AVP6_9BILA|nr:hypothetical protein A3Q56_06198 [Intoshia linei]
MKIKLEYKKKAAYCMSFGSMEVHEFNEKQLISALSYCNAFISESALKEYKTNEINYPLFCQIFEKCTHVNYDYIENALLEFNSLCKINNIENEKKMKKHNKNDNQNLESIEKNNFLKLIQNTNCIIKDKSRYHQIPNKKRINEFINYFWLKNDSPESKSKNPQNGIKNVLKNIKKFDNKFEDYLTDFANEQNLIESDLEFSTRSCTSVDSVHSKSSLTSDKHHRSKKSSSRTTECSHESRNSFKSHKSKLSGSSKNSHKSDLLNVKILKFQNASTDLYLESKNFVNSMNQLPQEKQNSVPQMKGYFFAVDPENPKYNIDSDNVYKQYIVNHTYRICVTEPCKLWLYMQISNENSHSSIKSAHNFIGQLDATMLVIPENCFHNFQQGKKFNGNHSDIIVGVKYDDKIYAGGYFEQGTYIIIPCLGGCKFRHSFVEASKHVQLVSSTANDEDEWSLTFAYKQALEKIFSMCNYDSSGVLSRSEFNFFTIQTNGEPINDEEWNILSDYINMRNNCISFDDFVKLHLIEANDMNGDDKSFWDSLESMGFNRDLYLVNSVEFTLSIYSKNSITVTIENLKVNDDVVLGIFHYLAKLANNFVSLSFGVTAFLYHNEIFGILIVENISTSDVNVFIDLSHEKYTYTSIGPMRNTIPVVANSLVDVMSICPSDNLKHKWNPTIIISIQ